MRFLLTLAVTAIALTVAPDLPAKKPVQLRVGSYNLRRAKLDAASPDNNWQVREPRLIQSILDAGFDICGLQEVDSDEQVTIPLRLADEGAEYGSYFFSPYSEDGHGTKAHGVIWRKDRFKLVGKPHYFWISDPPDRKQYNDIKGSHKFIRGGFCVVLKDRKAGRKYLMMVTHAPLNRELHAKNAHVFMDIEKKYNPKGWPSFFVGDFNAVETDDAHAVYRSHWTDSYHAFDDKPELRKGPEGTFNGWKSDAATLFAAHRIDYVYFRGKGVEPLNYVCNDSLYDGHYASDHHPIWVDFQIK